MMHLPPPQKKRGGNQAKNPKSDQDTVVPLEDEQNYGIDHLNLGELANESKMTPNESLLERKEL